MEFIKSGIISILSILVIILGIVSYTKYNVNGQALSNSTTYSDHTKISEELSQNINELSEDEYISVWVKLKGLSQSEKAKALHSVAPEFFDEKGIMKDIKNNTYKKSLKKEKF